MHPIVTSAQPQCLCNPRSHPRNSLESLRIPLLELGFAMGHGDGLTPAIRRFWRQVVGGGDQPAGKLASVSL